MQIVQFAYLACYPAVGAPSSCLDNWWCHCCCRHDHARQLLRKCCCSLLLLLLIPWYGDQAYVAIDHASDHAIARCVDCLHSSWDLCNISKIICRYLLARSFPVTPTPVLGESTLLQATAWRLSDERDRLHIA